MRPRWVRASLGVGAALVGVWGCHSPVTELVVRVSTDLPQGCPSGVAAVRVEARANGVRAFLTELALDPGNPRARLPREVGLYPRDDAALGHPVEVVATALDRDGAALVTRRAIARYTPERVVLLEVPLSARCVGPAGACPDGQTCVEGRCQEVRVATALPEYTPAGASVPLACDAGRDGALEDVPRGDSGVPLDVPRDTVSDGRDVPSDLPDRPEVPVVTDTGTLTDSAVVRDAPTDVGVDAVVVTGPTRLLSPLSTALVTSTRPVLRWRLGVGAARVRLELCRLRRCSGGSTTVSTVVSGESYTVIAPLPAGTVYWRVTPLDASGNPSGAPTPWWQFSTSTVTASVTSWWGRSPDFDGDGYPEGVLAAVTSVVGAGGVLVYQGTASGPIPTSTPWRTYPGAVGAALGTTAASAGDLNGDGYGDLALGAPGTSARVGAVLVYYGDTMGPPDLPSLTLDGPGGLLGFFGHSVAGAGDVNGDGYGDLLVGAYNERGASGAVYLYLGGSAGLSSTYAQELRPVGTDTSGFQFGWSVAGLGDVDGDGYDDVAVGANNAVSATGRVYLYRGSPRGLVEGAPRELSGPGEGAHFGEVVVGPGDLNGDGRPDLAVGANLALVGTTNAGRVFVYAGSTALGRTTLSVLDGPDGARGAFGYALSGIPDLNGDGLGELAVGASGAQTSQGRVHVYLGTRATPWAPARVSLDGSDLGGRFGHSVAGLDLDGDGHGDLLVGAPGASTNRGRVYPYRTRSLALPTTPSGTVVNPEGNPNFFGSALAGTR